MNTNSSSATAVNPILNNSIQANSTEDVGVNASTSNLTTTSVKNSDDPTTNTAATTTKAVATTTTTNPIVTTTTTNPIVTTTTTNPVVTTTKAAVNTTTTNPIVTTTKAVVNTTTTKSTPTNTTTQLTNSTEAAGAPVLVNGLTVAQLKKGLTMIAYFNLHHSLPPYVVFGGRQITIATFEKNLATQGLKINTTIVNGLTVAELNSGLTYAQAYFNLHHSLPPYVVFGGRQITIATFEKNLATQGLKINTTIVNGLTVAQLKDGLAKSTSIFQ